jgi:hypothetical protein
MLSGPASPEVRVSHNLMKAFVTLNLLSRDAPAWENGNL